MLRGYKSVGASQANKKVPTNKAKLSLFFACEKYHKATPTAARIKVGDSDLWLKTIRKINKFPKKTSLNT